MLQRKNYAECVSLSDKALDILTALELKLTERATAEHKHSASSAPCNVCGGSSLAKLVTNYIWRPVGNNADGSINLAMLQHRVSTWKATTLVRRGTAKCWMGQLGKGKTDYEAAITISGADNNANVQTRGTGNNTRDVTVPSVLGQDVLRIHTFLLKKNTK